MLDDNGLTIGSYTNKKNKPYLEICQTVAPRFTITMEKLDKYQITTEDIIVDILFDDPTVEDQERSAYVFIKEFEIQADLKSYIVTLAKNKRTLTLSLKYLPILADKLRNLMDSFEIDDNCEF
ncbi:MAG: hypothetical protein GF364_09090 [Candidatus Lokiarchaeota archaeon]|nr:hypothetical protein [Candidatus Lokiarchaeota archaeon]